MRKGLLLLLLVMVLGACSMEEDVKAEQDSVNAEEKDNPVEQPEENSEEDKKTAEAGEKEDEPQEEEAYQQVSEPLYELSGNWAVKPIDDQANEKVALVTIDDAPDKFSVDMAKTLKELEAPAIFFVNGHFLDTPEEEEKLKQIHELGFPIGNHTFNHASLPSLTEEEQYEEIVGLNDRIEEIIGERPVFFRAPFGQNTDYSKQLVEEEGMLLMNWTYGYDWEQDYQTASAIADIMVESPLLADGANLLMHDREWTAEGLEDIVIGLEEKGFEILDPLLIKRP
ncbi:polysaccharide deacetylase family protein [Thalassobacillus sp. B23F22_16]|uniref:polysaccharide deacetylase family protein n=1 Tax=Thalassobacillus sp. B23F22_16 TaxID=3459513 RepID=UPI00373EBEA3